MVAPPTPADEDHRLEALHDLGLLDTSADPRFDRITRIACSVAKVPIALICFVDRHRQWFMSRQGLDIVETVREISFCGHAILREEPLVVPDALEDPRFVDNPLVTGSPFGRFYAGYPIHAPGGARVGTLCVLDTQPRMLSTQELGALGDLAALVDAELLAVRFDTATRTVGVGVHERRAGDDEMWWSDAMWDLFGQPRCTFRPSADSWLAMVHPEDQDYVRANGGAWGRSRTSLSIQYRIIRPDGTIRHLQSIACKKSARDGFADRIAGITFDVTERVTAEQRQLAHQQQLRENSHQAGVAEFASGVLHSVGNVVNSLGIANETMRRDIKAARVEQLEQASALIYANRAILPLFLSNDERGRHLPEYLPALSAEISSKVQAVQLELDIADALLEQLRVIVSAQQERAQVEDRHERVDLKELLDSALGEQAFERSKIAVARRYGHSLFVMTDRHKLRSILMNILDNARDAVLASAAQPGRIIVQLGRENNDAVILIEDSGVGMSPEVLAHLWRFGFTTKPSGKGFDLHNSANAAREIGATIVAHSDGADNGSRFVLRLPLLDEQTPEAVLV